MPRIQISVIMDSATESMTMLFRSLAQTVSTSTNVQYTSMVNTIMVVKLGGVFSVIGAEKNWRKEHTVEAETNVSTFLTVQ